MSQEKTGRLPLIGGAVAAVAASLCCAGPLVLVMLGVGGAWIGNLAALEPFRPYFLGAAVIALLFAWKTIYRAPAACTPGSACALPQASRRYQVLFRIVAVLVAAAFAFPYLAPLFY